MGIAGRCCAYVVPVFVNHIQLHVPGAVATKGCIDIPTETFERGKGSLQFYAKAIALGNVARHHLTVIILRSGKHKLVFIVHIINVGTGREQRRQVFIPYLEVAQPLFLRFYGICLCHHILKVVACRFLMRYGIRRIYRVVIADAIIDAELRIEEVILLIDVERQLIALVVVLLRRTLRVVCHMTVLQINEPIESWQQFVGQFAVDIAVGLARIVVVVSWFS